MADESAAPVAAFPDWLRALASWLEDHPDVAEDFLFLAGNSREGVKVEVFAQGAAHLASLIRSVGGRWQKGEIGDYLVLTREVAPGVIFEINGNREKVCERVVVGMKAVEEPDPELLADVPLVTREVEVYEWRCEPILAAVSGETPSGGAGSDA